MSKRPIDLAFDEPDFPDVQAIIAYVDELEQHIYVVGLLAGTLAQYLPAVS
jgi:hypothetical protein